MAIEKKLIHFGKLADFEAQLTAGNILDRSIVFIQDAKKIWTHGTYYDCSEGTDLPDSVYVTDFTVNDLLNLVENPDSALSADFQSLYEAFAIHKVVLVPYDTREGYTGYGIANGCREDMLYFSVKIEGGRCIEAEVNDGDQLYGRDVYMATYVPGESLKTINGLSLIGAGDITVGGEDNVQSDWNVTDSSSDAYIKNKPTIPTKVSDLENDINFVTPEDVAAVALSGSYNDLHDTPTIPDAVTENTVSGWGFTKNTGTYSKPSGGIPTSDLDGMTRTVLEMANQDHQVIEDINSDVANLYDVKQDNLVSGTNIKTINGESILGSGDITIEGGESSQPMVSTTWAELKEMRDSASLVAGTWYRITDYVTTTSQSGTRSLEHPFDVIVLATGADTLSEEARAARHEGDISISVSLMGVNFWYKGVLTVDGVEWFEFESAELGSLVTSSATPAIGDIVYPYFDGMVVTEEAYPIESVSESENEYFLNNNANLDAWKIWYCLDNDKARFPWAVAKTKKSIVVELDEATLLTAEYNGTYEYEGIMYYRWDVFYSGMNVLFLTVSDNPKAGDTTSVYGVIEMDMFLPYPIPIVSVNEPSENEGLGVIYRMIDEQNNDIPYDFKNIQFVRKVTLGKLDLENGTDEFVFTFNSFDENTGRSSDFSFNRLLCSGNNMKMSFLGLNDIVFLNESTSLVGCYSNTFGDNCYSNTFGDGCDSNTFGDNCYSNTFGDSCDSNTFGDVCNSNTFGDVCNSNTFGDNCHSNTFGDVCYSNTFGDNCYSNTFGNYCDSNTFGDDCYSNTFGESADALVYSVRYYTLANGIYSKFLSVEGNRSCETKVAYNSIGELKMYCEADLAD